MRAKRTVSEFLNKKLKRGQVYKIYDLRKSRENVFTVWSIEQLNQLFESGKINDKHFGCSFGKSAEMGYSSTQIPWWLKKKDDELDEEE